MNFGTLRSLLHSSQYTTETWQRLCREAEHYRDPIVFDDMVLPYLTPHLERWTDTQRQMPMNWVFAMSQGQDIPWLEMTRALHWNKGPDAQHPTMTSLNNQQLQALCLQGPARPWTTLRLIDALAQPDVHLTALIDALPRTLGNVNALTIHTQSLSIKQVEHFVEHLPATALTHLELSYRRMDMSRLGSLLQSPESQWHHLSLPSCGLSPVMMDLLSSKLPYWRNLKTLDLRDNHLDRRGYQALALLVANTPLESLDLRQTTYQHQGLFTLNGKTPLKHLYLSGIEDTTFDWEKLLSRPWLSQLETLHIEHSTQGDSLLKALDQLTCQKTLRTLVLDQCQVSARGISALGAVVLPHLTTLDLSHNRFYEDFLHHLGSLETLPALKTLHLRGDFLSPKNLGALAQHAPFEALEHLDLSNSNLHFQHHPVSQWLSHPTLQSLNLRNISLNRPLKENIAKQAHRMEVQTGHFSPFRHDPTMAAVESCLQEYPSAQLWGTLSKLFHTINKELYDAANIKQINNKLDQWWPSALRTPTQLWWQRFNLHTQMPVWWTFLRSIYINSDAQMLEHMVEQPNMRQVEHLTLNWYYHFSQQGRFWGSQNGHPNTIDRLLRSQSVQGVRALTLQCNAPNLSLFNTLSATPHLKNLEHLHIQTQRIPGGGTEQLAMMSRLSQLLGLTIQQRLDGPMAHQVTHNIDNMLNVLNGSPLTQLSLEGITLNQEQLRLLCALDLSALKSLYLKHNSLNDRDMVTMLLRAPSWFLGLETLRLNQSVRLTDSTIEALSHCVMPNLKRLDLMGNTTVSPQSRRWFEDNGNFPKLRHIIWPT